MAVVVWAVLEMVGAVKDVIDMVAMVMAAYETQGLNGRSVGGVEELGEPKL
jgi:hypothetical protein